MRDEGDVPVGPKVVQQPGPGLVALADEAAQEGGGGRCVALGEVVGLGAQPLQEDVGVPDVAEQVGRPLELVAEGLGLGLVEQGPERAQVGAQAPGRHPGLVHVLGVVADAHARVMAQKAGNPGGQRRPHGIARL